MTIHDNLPDGNGAQEDRIMSRHRSDKSAAVLGRDTVRFDLGGSTISTRHRLLMSGSDGRMSWTIPSLYTAELSGTVCPEGVVDTKGERRERRQK